MHLAKRRWIVLILVLLTPGLALAQAAIAGVVKDASGDVLPGVTVEAAAPRSLKKTLAGDGRHGAVRIGDLRLHVGNGLCTTESISFQWAG